MLHSASLLLGSLLEFWGWGLALTLRTRVFACYRTMCRPHPIARSRRSCAAESGRPLIVGLPGDLQGPAHRRHSVLVQVAAYETELRLPHSRLLAKKALAFKKYLVLLLEPGKLALQPAVLLPHLERVHIRLVGLPAAGRLHPMRQGARAAARLPGYLGVCGIGLAAL